MQTNFRPLFGALLLLAGLLSRTPANAQIPAAPTTGVPDFKINGTADQPFTMEVLDAHRTVTNTLLVRLAITNRGNAPLEVTYEFAAAQTPAEAKSISGIYAIDPNGEAKYTVLRNAKGTSICSRINPVLQSGERRNLFTQLAAPPDTSSSVGIFVPHAGRIENVPIGLPTAGEAVPPDASIGDPGAYPSPAAAPLSPPNAALSAPNTTPNVVTDQLGDVPPAGSHKAIGSIQDGNSVVPFTVEVLGLKRQPDGKMKLRLALTNNSSGPLDADGQFNSGIADLAASKQISGVYLADPVTHARFEVVRPTQVTALCSSISPALAPGERRTLEAEFADLPAAVKSVYVYFPHASPVADIPVGR
jgi:hypothetical protein